jgi:hypothetical protein
LIQLPSNRTRLLVGRAERLGRFTAAGVDLDGSVSLPPGVAQYADQVVASEVRPVDGGVEVTVVAHLLLLRSRGYRDAGTQAFVVPLVGGADGLAVRDAPRPTSLPVAAGRPVGRPQVVPASVAPAAARAAPPGGGGGGRAGRLGAGVPSGWVPSRSPDRPRP